MLVLTAYLNVLILIIMYIVHVGLLLRFEVGKRLDSDVSSCIKIAKMWSYASPPWMIIHISLLPRLFKVSRLRILIDDIFLVAKNYIIRWC